MNEISADIQRFILKSIDSVSQLEAILLLRSNPNQEWDAKTMSERLFVTEKKTENILADLSEKGMVSVTKDTALYRYEPRTKELQEIINRTADIYSTNLIKVTNLIHSKINKQAQDFGDAFKFRKEGE